MQRQSYSQEEKTVNREVVRSRFLSVRPPSEQESISIKLAPWHAQTKSNLLNAHSHIKQHRTLSSVPLDNYDDLLDIRSSKKHRKSAHSNDDNIKASIITINVSGDRYQTHLSTLQLYPDTLLGNENKRKIYWNSETKEYFFDRHRTCFEAILYYYQSNGRLRRPDFVPLDTFLEEIAFFELGKEASTQVHQVENIKEVKQSPMPRLLWRRYIWFYFEYPQHSLIARIISLVSIFFTILSCVGLAVESLPKYTDHWDNICKEEANISLNSTFVPRCPALFFSPFFIIQTICVAYFTIEFLLRLISTPSYYRFVLSFCNWIDLSAVVSYYVFLIIELADRNIGLDTGAILAIRILRVLRFSRIFKIYMVFRRLKSLRVLSATIRESLIDFTVMITILTLLAFLFGAATYLAEQPTNGDVFDSIPKATYWGIITITGVGYGDMCPITAVGRILTCLCALVGSATMGMLISVLVDRYQRVYNRKMYVCEPEIPTPDIDIIGNPDDETKSVFSSQKLSRRRNFSGILTQQLSTIQNLIKNDRHQPYKLQFVVSFNDNNTKDYSSADHLVTTMKKKLTEVIATTDIDVNLKLIDNDSKELWTISSSVSPAISVSNLILSTDMDDKRQTKIEVF